MTADRLRQAASYVEDDPMYLIDPDTADKAAALLRAAAQQHDNKNCRCGYITASGIGLDIGVDIRCDAADALADMILGPPASHDPVSGDLA